MISKILRKLTPHDRIARADAAKAEMRITADAFKALGERYIRDWAKTAPDEADRREALWRSYTTLAHVERDLINTIADGLMAAKELGVKSAKSD